ncbi:MAG TPA: hypothetical protein H9887_05025 [Candidatus Dorea intestinavium]|nr:hypothetical protein [Candidatus Dorea intestinavium]
MKKENKIGKILIIILGAYCLSLVLGAWYYCLKGEVLISKTIIIKVAFLPSTLIGSFLIALFLSIYYKFQKTILDFIYKYRFLIAFIVFIACVLFEISGSSIGAWAGYFKEKEAGVLFGVNRAIRSDEWAVSTPMALSQYYGDNPFSYFSNIFRGTKTDMFLVYGQAVKDIGMIFRPFYLGYLFLTPARGMAFFWCGRLIALTLVNFEFGMLISNKRKDLAFVYTLLISFSPVVQWWFAINGLVEMLIYIQLSILMLNKYMEDTNTRKRILYALVIMICAGGFILVLYPAWQMPFFYILIGLILFTFIVKIKECEMKKKDWVVIVIITLIFGILMYHIYDKSQETLKTVLNTAYPGKRIIQGGGRGRETMDYVSNLWPTLTNLGLTGSAPESARFISFFPLSYIMALWIVFKEKRKDSFLIIFMIITVFLGFYCAFGFSQKVAIATMLSYSTGERALIAFGFSNVLLFIRSLAMIKTRMNKALALLVAGVLTITISLFSYSINPNYYSKLIFLLTVVLFLPAFYGALANWWDIGRKSLIWSLSVIAIISGAMVNPIRTGISDIVEFKEFKEIRKIVQEDPHEKWVINGLGFPMFNFTIMNGAPTINSTNTYPNLKLWNSLNVQNQSQDLYNRYANLRVELTEDRETFFEYNNPDSLTVYVNIKDFKKLGVKYVYSQQDIRSLDFGPYLVEKVGTNIYKVY